ncbi:hypothetical protein B0H66DRAFT_136660 [Apodospora peruviana]|uniref:Uncharacterized protein n=1 Tax=Apodospora peruviana TaxID=516989 RepID=A0AAE0IIK6_9PEZI|nr:hypothetical protein B0H66DRAFT_136660 [Apodospora peruviana]
MAGQSNFRQTSRSLSVTSERKGAGNAVRPLYMYVCGWLLEEPEHDFPWERRWASDGARQDKQPEAVVIDAVRGEPSLEEWTCRSLSMGFDRFCQPGTENGLWGQLTTTASNSQATSECLGQQQTCPLNGRLPGPLSLSHCSMETCRSGGLTDGQPQGLSSSQTKPFAVTAAISAANGHGVISLKGRGEIRLAQPGPFLGVRPAGSRLARSDYCKCAKSVPPVNPGKR